MCYRGLLVVSSRSSAILALNLHPKAKLFLALSLCVSRWPVSRTIRKNKQPTSIAAEKGERRSRPALVALFVTFSMKSSANIASNNYVPVIPITRRTIVFTWREGNVAMEPTLGSVCVCEFLDVHREYVYVCLWDFKDSRLTLHSPRVKNISIQ